MMTAPEVQYISTRKTSKLFLPTLYAIESESLIKTISQ